MQGSEKLQKYAGVGVFLHTAFTIFTIALLFFAVRSKGAHNIWWLVGKEKGTWTVSDWNAFCEAAIVWLLFGSILWLIRTGIINGGNAFRVFLFYMFAFGNILFMTFRTGYGDLPYYIEAAFNLYRGEEYGIYYVYPPLWGTCLQMLVPFGWVVMTLVCVCVNYLSLLLFYILSCKALEKYGFSKDYAAINVFVLLTFNFAVLYTSRNVQVNFHVMNCILLCLLLYRRNKFLSALALCLAVHLKTSPAMLVLCFLVARDWKWLLYFGLVFAMIVLSTSFINDFHYYYSFLKNVRYLIEVHSYRQNSIDTFLKFTLDFLGVHGVPRGYFVWPIKAFFLAVGLACLGRAIGKKSFFEGSDRQESTVFNGLAVLLVSVVLLSPIIWGSHMVFITLSFLVFQKQITDLGKLLLYGLVYWCLFLIPVFNVYPFTYNRLFGLIMLHLLMWYFSGSSKPAKWFVEVNDRLREGIVRCVRGA